VELHIRLVETGAPTGGRRVEAHLRRADARRLEDPSVGGEASLGEDSVDDAGPCDLAGEIHAQGDAVRPIRAHLDLSRQIRGVGRVGEELREVEAVHPGVELSLRVHLACEPGPDARPTGQLDASWRCDQTARPEGQEAIREVGGELARDGALQAGALVGDREAGVCRFGQRQGHTVALRPDPAPEGQRARGLRAAILDHDIELFDLELPPLDRDAQREPRIAGIVGLAGGCVLTRLP
jgi:hypothetical protein